MHIKKLAVIPAIAALVILSACGGDDDDGGSDTQTQDLSGSGDVGAGLNPDAVGPATAPEGAAEGGTLTVLTAVAPETIDPTRAYYVDSTAILNLVTRGLTGYQRQEDGSYVLVPDMATDLGQVSDDGLEWTFTLKDDIRYNDGSPVTADDIAYAIKRSFAQDVLTAGPLYQNEFFLDGDTYKGPYTDGDDYAGVEVVDDKTITIKLAKPFNDLPYYASFPMFTGIPEAKDTKLDYEREIMATGPYMIEEYIPQRSLTLVQNPEWEADTDPIRTQLPDEWVFEWAQDSNQVQERIIGDNGEDQTTLTYDEILSANYRQLLDQPGGEDRLVTGTQPCTYMQFLDTRVIPLEVRKAIGTAYPSQAANQAAGLIPDLTAIPATTIMPPGVPGRVEYDAEVDSTGNGDPEAAKQMLEDAGEVGFEVSFYFQTDVPESVRSSEVIEEGLEQAGFEVKRLPSTSEEIRADLDNPDAPVNMRGSGWCSDWPSGSSWFPPVFDGSLISPDTVPNMSFLDEPEVNKTNDRILSMPADQTAEAAEAWGKLDETVMNEYYPAVLRYVPGSAFMHGSRVGGMFNDSYRGMPDFSTMFVVPE